MLRVPLTDPRVPPPVALACETALAEGRDVDSWEQDTGNPRLPRALVVQAWVPWASPIARILRAAGGRDTTPDECRGFADESYQCVSWQEPAPPVPALFRLVRDVDATGVSGTGHVADGVVWHDGTVAVRWRTDTRSTVIYDSVAAVEKIHGHGGMTRIVWE